MFGEIVDYTVDGQKVTLAFEHGNGRIEAITETIVNVFSAFESTEKHSYAIEGRKELPVSLKVKREENCVVIQTPK